MTALLKVEALCGGYGRVEVLRSLSIEVGTGESVALLGANGHGKTTMLETISGLIRPTAGTISFDGRDITRAKPAQIVSAGLTHIPQGSALFPRLTVTENLMLGGRLPHARAARAETLDSIHSLFPKLHQRRDQLVGTLSGGERQMVAIGMGLMAKPKLLILDEPTLGLAPKVRSEILAALREVRFAGLSLLVTDGDVDFLFELTDRWYLVELGRVTGAGTAASRPSHEDVMAMYVGSATSTSSTPSPKGIHSV